MSSTKMRVPAVEGLFTMDESAPALIGGKARTRGSYFFPKDLGGSDPMCVGDEIDEVVLSRTGKIWSWTTSSYPPPPPFMVNTEPYVPIVIAAVELDVEKMVVLGQVVAGVGVEELSLGQEVEIVLETLYEDDDNEYLVWKWRPTASAKGAQ